MKEFLNPFEEGVTYEAFLKSIPKGEKLENYLKDKLSEEQIEILRRELIIK